MHFWIDKRSSQLHQYGGGRRPGGAGGFYSQNFGTHRSTHHPPPSLGHHHPHRLRTRTSSTTNATTSTTATTSAGGGSSSNNNNSIHNLLSSATNNNNLQMSHPIANGNPSSSTSALQYPHQQPHHVQQQHAVISSAGVMYGSSGGNPSSGSRLISVGGSRNGGSTTFFSQPPQHQPIFGGGILAISGSSGGAVNVAAMNPPMAIIAGDDESGTLSSTTVLTFPPSATQSAANPRGGIDLSWRNPYHVPGSSVSRCRAYARDGPPPGSSAASTSRGTRGRRTSSSSQSSGVGRNSLGTNPGVGVVGTPPNYSQNVTIETPEGLTDRSTRTSFDRDTVTPQRSLSLTSPDAVDQNSHGTSSGGRPSIESDPGWACTKRVGLTLCFLAFILLGTVGAKFMIQGPGVIDGSRTGKAEAAAYFLFTELIFIAFAMFLFFTGVACLRKRTNDYLLRQFNQYILNSSASPPTGGLGGIPGQDAYDFEYYDGTHPHGGGSPSSRGHHHHHHLHHNLHHGGFHHYRHHRSSGSLIEEGGEFGSAGDLSQHNFHGAGPYHYPAHFGNGGGGGGSRHGRSKPPPYEIAILLPLPDPEGLGGSASPTQEYSNNNEMDGNKPKLSASSDGIGFIDSSSVKDAQDAAGGNNVNYSGSSENRDSNSRNERGAYDDCRDRRSETPPPPYEQL